MAVGCAARRGALARRWQEVTVGELLAIVGRSWVRLLLYPGGASALLLALAALSRSRPWRGALLARHPWLALAAPWLAIAMLPLPGAADLGYWPDCVVTLALLDLPWLAALARDLGADHQRAARSLASLLNGYPPLLLGLLLCGGTFDLRQMFAAPAAQPAGLLHWMGAAAITCALPPLLGLGPFAQPPREDGYALPLALRGVGYCCVAALPWLVPLDGQIWQALPPLGLGLGLWGFHAASRRARSRPWAWGYLTLDVALVCGLAAGAGFALAQRFQ